ncbi:HNH endonuclease [Parashewanella tropica]|uniref:HNH endonuclease n=1 Tax=Parashewanella tropica TaxID=2547970 RepID=UPI001059B9AC|nr:HNH endonuclease signature motif containing protein [Parashewanella tropica]
MNSYFALHKDYEYGQEFKTSMGYGFKPESSQNWFKESLKGTRVHPTEGSFVYVIQREKGSKFYQLVGKYRIVRFSKNDVSWGNEKTHRAKLEELMVPNAPVFLNDAALEEIGKQGYQLFYDDLVQELRKQNSSFRQPLKKNVGNMLDWLLKIAIDEPQNMEEPFDESYPNPEDAYKVAEMKVRKGQERFRKNVENVWKGKKCAVTGINFEPLLIASHIVRFSDCKNGEHWDGANGMFLTAHIDALFDKHLITFVKKAGKYQIKFSKNVEREALSALKVNECDELKIADLESKEYSRFEKYMLEHNKIFDTKNR